jgi:argininosuccinate synthase
MKRSRIVLAWSGGLASTAAIPWLIDRHRADVVAVALDLGQGTALDGVRERALDAGAIRCHVLDHAAALVRDVAWPVARAGVDRDPGGAVLASPLIARALVDVARLERATTVAHGCRDECAARRLSQLVRTLDRTLDVAAPALALGPDRPALGAYLESRGMLAAGAGDTTLLVDQTLWGRVVTGAALADPWEAVPESLFTLTRASHQGPDAPATLDVAFDRGVPVQVNGVEMPLPELVDVVATIAGAHGVGRLDRMAADTPPRREMHESPAAVVLRQAHRDLEGATLSADQEAFRPTIAGEYAALLADGRWYSPLRSALDAYVDAVQSSVSGTVRMRLYKGDCRVVARRAARYHPAPADAGVAR